MGQTIRDSHVPSQRTENKYTKLSATLVRHIVAALFTRVPDEPALPPPLQAGAFLTSRHPGKTSKSMQEDQGSHCAWVLVTLVY
ncbi:unnamed protein product [Trichogramma brassicae]|uniref:Uncharacterized protein n=1 Tax=Trichogramma brassicae TaxID=86971 RepID=A0A6H5J1L9_9HYME|nr:unnamed protein product [Trichogramma brassicae]